MLYERLHALARQMRPDQSLQEAASVVATRLMQNGPRGVRPGDPYATDEMVDFYLRRALRNGRIDEVRRAGRFEELDPGLRTLSWSQEEALERGQAGEAIASAIQVVFGKIVLEVPDSAREAVLDRREVAEGRRSFDQCVRERHGEVSGQNRNRFYQQQSRGMRRLADAAESYIANRSMSPMEAWAIRVVLGELRDADAGWSVTTEGA